MNAKDPYEFIYGSKKLAERWGSLSEPEGGWAGVDMYPGTQKEFDQILKAAKTEADEKDAVEADEAEAAQAAQAARAASQFLTQLLGIENEATELENIVSIFYKVRGVTPSEDQMNPMDKDSVPARMNKLDNDIKTLLNDLEAVKSSTNRRGTSRPAQIFDKELLARLQAPEVLARLEAMVVRHQQLVDQVEQVKQLQNPLWGRW